ncbi:MAG: FAD:protein FMN transferase [Rhodothermales bacterium]|nr:FAD:protein FMN transferase [Rhodothermales bacterium]
MRQRVAVHAMATRFECVLLGEQSARLRSIGEAALREITSLESRLSFYDGRSELSRINREAARTPVPLAPDVMDLLLLCRRIHRMTHGAFDPTVAGLMSAWGFTGTAHRVPGTEERRRALQAVGMDRVELDENRCTVRFETPGVSLDLGGVAKGYALDVARTVLEDHGIENALLHGGTSTVLALGTDEDGRTWNVGLADPWADQKDAWFRRTDVDNECLSVSAVSGKSFVDGDVEYGHVIDPRSGEAVSGQLVAACVAPSAAEADALSTAMLVLMPEETTENLGRCARFRRTTDGWTIAAGRFDD